MTQELQAAGLFAVASQIAIGGWLLLLISIVARWRFGRDVLAMIVIPTVLSLGYAAIIAVHWASASGGFNSLAAVTALFQSPWMLLAGWVHFLAFDLFIGAWIAREAEINGVSRWLILPIMPLTLMFGPMGLLAWLILRVALAPKSTPALMPQPALPTNPTGRLS